MITNGDKPPNTPMAWGMLIISTLVFVFSVTGIKIRISSPPPLDPNIFCKPYIPPTHIVPPTLGEETKDLVKDKDLLIAELVRHIKAQRQYIDGQAAREKEAYDRYMMCINQHIRPPT